jgi:hypothetical protein
MLSIGRRNSMKRYLLRGCEIMKKTKGVWIRYRDIKKHFNSVKEAADFIGATPKALYEVIAGRKMAVYGWSVWYDDEEEQLWIRNKAREMSNGET